MFEPERKRMLNAAQGNSETDGYRTFYLPTDVKRAKIALLFFIIPVIGYVFNDYNFFGFSTVFFGLVALRLSLIIILVLSAFFMDRIKNYHTYDRVMFLTIIIMAVGGGIVNVMRPTDFVVQALVTIIAVFVIFLLVPFRFLYQCILSFSTSLSEALIILFITRPTESAVLFTILFGILISNIIAAAGAYQLHGYRINTYREFVKRKEAQEKLEQHTKNLEELVEERTRKLRTAERFAAIGETAGMVGHDLRNPLTGISNATYYLKKKYSQELDKTGRDMLEVIENNVEYSNKIINDLLDYAGNINLDLQDTTPKALVSESLDMITLPKNIEVHDLTENTPNLALDMVKMKRVFVNILKNAIDAMPEGGQLIIKSQAEGETVKVSFIDTGAGISVEELKKLFQPLYTTKAKGMGFGLAICQRIVEAHGGKIVVESTVGQGAVFKVELPIKATKNQNK